VYLQPLLLQAFRFPEERYRLQLGSSGVGCRKQLESRAKDMADTREDFGANSLRADREEMGGEKKGKRKLYEFRRKKAGNLSDNMNKIGECNKQGYQIKRGRRLTFCMSSLRLGL
jgi:hypothetical protein